MASLSTPPFQYQERGAAALTEDSLVEKRDSDLEHYLWTPYNHSSSAYSTANQITGNNVVTLVLLDTIDWDPEALFNLATDSWVCPFDGIWTIAGGITWEVNTAGSRRFRFGVNGAPLIGQGGPAAGAGYPTEQTASRDVNLIAGDVIAMYGQQSSGGNLNITFAFLQVSYKSRPSFVG